MIESSPSAIEATVWKSMATIADRLARNPRGRCSVELAQTRAHLVALKTARQHQLDDLMAQLVQSPHDLDVRQLVDQGNARLADLQIAEAILIALSD